jgi:hypothetical protein
MAGAPATNAKAGGESDAAGFEHPRRGALKRRRGM